MRKAERLTGLLYRRYRVGVLADASGKRDLPGPNGNDPGGNGALAGLGDRIVEIVDVAMLEAMKVA